MPTYTAPTKDMQFVLHELLNVSTADTPGYSELEADFTAAVLEEAGKLASEVLSPLNTVGDSKGCACTELTSASHNSAAHNPVTVNAITRTLGRNPLLKTCCVRCWFI